MSQDFGASVISLVLYLRSSEEEVMKIVEHHHCEILPQQTSFIKNYQKNLRDLIEEREGNEVTTTAMIDLYIYV